MPYSAATTKAPPLFSHVLENAMKLLVIAPLALMFAHGAAFADDAPAVSADDAIKAALVDTLNLLKDNKFDDWIKKYCATDTLCLNGNSVRELKRYQLPAKARRANACLRDGGKSVDVQKVKDVGPNQKKVFLNCEETAMPVPFHLQKVGEKWMFSSI